MPKASWDEEAEELSSAKVATRRGMERVVYEDTEGNSYWMYV